MHTAISQRLRAVAPYMAILAGVLISAWPVVMEMGQRIIGLAEQHWVKGVSWYYWNYATSPFRGINPLDNNLQAYPVGFNQLAMAGNMGDALHAVPFFWFFSLPTAYNLTAIFFLLFNAAAAYLFFRRWWGGRMLPVLFALANTFHPLFLFFLAEGRPTQLLFGWVYLALAGARALVDEPEHGSIRLLVAGLVGSFVCFWFNGFFLYLLLPVVWWSASRGMSSVQRQAVLRRGARALVLAALLAFPFGLPLLFDVFGGEGIKGVSMFNLPDARMHLLFAARLWEPLLLTPRYHMMLPYVSLAVIPLALLVGSRGSGRPSATLGFVLGGFFFYLLILGPYLQLGQGAITVGGYHVTMPWAWFVWAVPFYSRLSYPYLVFPFLLVVVLFIGGLLLSRLASQGGWRKGLAWCAGAALVLEVAIRGGWMPVTTPYIVPSYYEELARDSSVRAIIEYPFGAADFRQVYQTVHLKPMVNQKGHEFNFLQANPRLGKHFARTPGLAKLYAHQRTGMALATISAADRRQLVRQGFDVLLISRQAFIMSELMKNRGASFEGLVKEMSGLLGAPYYRGADLVAFRIRAGS